MSEEVIASTGVSQRPREWWRALGDRRRMTLLFSLVAAAALLPYLNALANGFAFDDAYIIQLNARVHNIRGWHDIWMTPYWPSLGRELGLYRPLTIFLFAVQWLLGGGARWPFHLVNIVLHACAAMLVMRLLQHLGARTVHACAGALVFAVHPIHTEAVANIVGQAEITATCLVLTACIVHAGRPAGVAVSWPRRVVIALLYGVALSAKESAVVLPGLLVLIDFMQRRVLPQRRSLLQYLDAMAFPIFALVAVLVAYLAVRYQALGGTLTGIDAGPAFPYLKEHRLLNAFRAFPEYLRLLFWPADLTVDYVPATVIAVTSLTLMAAVGLIVILALVALMFAVPWVPAVGAAPAWFLISISPVSNIFFPIGVLIAERTLYLPSVAVSILVATIAGHVASETQRNRRIIVGVFCAALVAMGIRTWIRNPDWKDTNAVQVAVFRDHPESYHAQWARALVSWDNAKLDEADSWFKLAYRTYPRDSGMLATYAAFLMAVGEDDRALPLARTSHDMHPFMANSTALLAFLYVTTHKPDSALAIIQAGERDDLLPLAMAMPMRAYVYQSTDRLDEAIAAWRYTARSMTSGQWLAWGYFARTLAFDQRDAEAHDAVRTGLAMTKDSASRALLNSVDEAVTNHCYARADASRIGDLYGPPTYPACDPLGSWFDHATTVQGASFSHFAIPRRLITARRVREKSPK